MITRLNRGLAGVAAIAVAGLVLAPGIGPVEADPRAPSGTGQDLRSGLGAADGVIHGTVTMIDYRMSTKKNPDDETLPYAFVTYKIHEKVSGRIDGDTLTLRFIGGPDGQGRVLTVTGVPLFNVGHEDALLIRGNGTRDCPLVNCESGRFRIFRGRVYNSHGVPITAVRQGRVIADGPPEPALLKILFPAPRFEDVIKRKDVQDQLKTLTPAGNLEDLRKRYESEAPKTIEYVLEVQSPREDRVGGTVAQVQATERGVTGGRSPIELAAFLKVLKDELRQMPKGADRVVSSVSPDQPFTIGPPRVTQPKGSTAPAPRGQETAEERRERELLEKQELDPVLKRSPR